MSMTKRDKQIVEEQRKSSIIYKTCMLNNVNLFLQAGESADCNEGYVNIITADPEGHEAIIIAQLWVSLGRSPVEDNGPEDSVGKRLKMRLEVLDCLMIGKRRGGLPIKWEFEIYSLEDVHVPPSRYICSDDLKCGFDYDEHLESLIAGLRGIGLEKFDLLRLAEPDVPADPAE